MAECNSDYTPGPWEGYSYADARKAYDPVRSYTTNSVSSSGIASSAPAAVVPENLTTNCKSPIIVVVDGTGSMGVFPETIFKKLPLLDDCAKDYLDDVEISYAIIGDAGCDRYGLQVQPFCKGTAMIDALNKLVIERGGGSNEVESYDLAALYYLENCHMPKAVNKPILIFVSDEGVYPLVDKTWAKQWAKSDLDGKMTAKQLFDKLQEKFSVYCIRKHYGYTSNDGLMTGSDLRIHRQWEDLVGSDRIAILQDPARVVDVMLGLLANETDKQDFFKKELTHRQRPDQVKEVMASMISIGKICGTDGRPSMDAAKGLSVAKRPDNSVSKNSKSLL